MVRFLWQMRFYFRQVAGEMALGSACGIVMNTAVVLPAVLLGRALDKALAVERGEASPSAAAVAALLFVGGTLATEVPRIGKRWWLMTANARIRANIRADAFRGVLAWPMPRLNRTPIGDLMARIVGDVEVLGVGVREFTIEMWDTVLFSISLVVAMAVYDFHLTLLALAPVPLAMLLAQASGRWVSGRTTASRMVNAEMTASIQENLAGARVLRLFERRQAAVDQVAALSGRQAEANLALTRLKSGLQPAYSTLMTAGIVLVVWQGGDRVISGAMTVGAFVAYLQLFVRFVNRGYRVPQLVNSVQSGAAAFERIEPLLARPLSMAAEGRLSSFRPSHLMGMALPDHPDRSVPRHAVSVSIESATFCYPGAPEPAFRNVSLHVPAGSFVAITGPVGSGKSALARCLAGIYAPDSGTILVDNVAAVGAAPGLVGYAPQDAYLFSGTIRENVVLEATAAESDSAEEAIGLAGLRGDVSNLPQGIETEVGELGIRISGGQRQRLALARAIGGHTNRSPGLLVLDDPFSAVDVDTEAEIVRNLRDSFGPGASADRRATIILFSHRLAAFPQADLVVVLDNGEIRERGRHDELLAEDGLYSRIFRAQRAVDRPKLAEGVR